MIKEITIRSIKKNEFIDITHYIKDEVRNSKLKEGVINIFVPHTTAGITINENADPSVKEDITNGLRKIAPEDANYEHLEGNADSHIKSTLVGVSLTIPFENGELLLGTWQGIFFTEFDGPRTRKFIIQIH